jgi:hypothetical protein
MARWASLSQCKVESGFFGVIRVIVVLQRRSTLPGCLPVIRENPHPGRRY